MYVYCMSAQALNLYRTFVYIVKQKYNYKGARQKPVANKDFHSKYNSNRIIIFVTSYTYCHPSKIVWKTGAKTTESIIVPNWKDGITLHGRFSARHKRKSKSDWNCHECPRICLRKGHIERKRIRKKMLLARTNFWHSLS